MNLDQFYQDVMEYNISPSVFEFDPNPQQHVQEIPQYEDTSTSGFLMRKLGFQQPYKSPEQIQAEAEEEQRRQEQQQIEDRKRWCREFRRNPITLSLNSSVWGKLDKQQLKTIKGILDKDEDSTYIYAGSKDRTETLNIDDVCAHVVKSKIKGNNLECTIQFDYSPAGMALYNNHKNGFTPKLNINTILTYNQKDPTKQDLKFNCLEFI